MAVNGQSSRPTPRRRLHGGHAVVVLVAVVVVAVVTACGSTPAPAPTLTAAPAITGPAVAGRAIVKAAQLNLCRDTDPVARSCHVRGRSADLVHLPDDPRPIEIARQPLSLEPIQEIPVTISSGPGSVRTIYVAEGDRQGIRWFEENKAHDGDSSWDGNRVTLPQGVRSASNRCQVIRTE